MAIERMLLGQLEVLAPLDLERLDLALARDALLFQRPLGRDLRRLDGLAGADLRPLAVHLPLGALPAPARTRCIARWISMSRSCARRAFSRSRSMSATASRCPGSCCGSGSSCPARCRCGSSCAARSARSAGSGLPRRRRWTGLKNSMPVWSSWVRDTVSSSSPFCSRSPATPSRTRARSRRASRAVPPSSSRRRRCAAHRRTCLPPVP